MEPVPNTTNQDTNYLLLIYLAKALKYFDFDTLEKFLTFLFTIFFLKIFYNKCFSFFFNFFVSRLNLFALKIYTMVILYFQLFYLFSKLTDT